MQASWLVEANMFEQYEQRLVHEIERQGLALHLLSPLKPGYSWDELGDNFDRLFPDDACVVFHGDIGLGTRLQQVMNWQPGVYADFLNLECTTYYCHFGEHLVNHDYTMLPFGELARRKAYLFENFGRDGKIFVRPNGCQKSFSGQLASENRWDGDLEIMAFYDVPAECLVVVSTPKTISNEWRFVIVANEVVAGCQYKQDGQIQVIPNAPADAYDLATTMAKHEWQPDRVWTCDICRLSTGKLRLLEIGSFSCADLYQCDLETVVRAVSQEATKHWRDSRQD